MDPVAEVVDKLKELGVDAAVVAQRGQLDIQPLLDAGWTWDEKTHLLHGKRIRVLKAPKEQA